MMLDEEDLKRLYAHFIMIYIFHRHIRGCRFKIALLLKSKVYDYFMVALIVLYTLFVLVQFGIDEQTWFINIENKVYVAELVVLGYFVIEIFVHLMVYRCLYMKDYWNIADVVVIVISIVFVVLDLSIKNNNALKNILNLRGVFRLLRVFILIRKLNVVRLKREIR